MIERNNPELDTTVLLERIDAIVQRPPLTRPAKPSTAAEALASSAAPYTPPMVEPDEVPTMAEFFTYHGRAFIDHAYRKLLKRAPEPAGRAHYLKRLQSGENPRNILVRLRYSKEGRARAVNVPGMRRAALRCLFESIPIIGSVVQLLGNIAQINKIKRTVLALQYSASGTTQELAHLHEQTHSLQTQRQSLSSLAHVQAQHAEQLSNLHKSYALQSESLARANIELERKADAAQTQQTLQTLHEALSDKTEQLHSALAHNTEQLESTLAHNTEQLQSALAHNTEQLQSNLDLEVEKFQSVLEHAEHSCRVQQRQIAFMRDELKQFIRQNGENTAVLPASTQAQNLPNLDAFYAAFEDIFRGSTEDIKQRVSVYLPYVQDLPGPVLDIGCGRGEWLQLLGEEAIACSGVDLNEEMIQRCHKLDIQATQADAIEYLCAQGDETLGAVTGFHIVEHLPFAQVAKLIDEVLRVLRPGGILLFETPNPENITVGATNFYMDPTHLNPIPPTMLEFVFQQRGFMHTQIKRLHPYPESFLIDEDSALAKRFNHYFCGPQDYAVIGRK